MGLYDDEIIDSRDLKKFGLFDESNLPVHLNARVVVLAMSDYAYKHARGLVCT
jgi:hypothetical protein